MQQCCTTASLNLHPLSQIEWQKLLHALSLRESNGSARDDYYGFGLLSHDTQLQTRQQAAPDLPQHISADTVGLPLAAHHGREVHPCIVT